MRKISVKILTCTLSLLLFCSFSVQAQTIYESMGKPVSNQSGLQEYEDMFTNDIWARTIYSEAIGESYTGKLAIYHIICNRQKKNSLEFGRPTFKDVLLHGDFDGLKTSYARCPNVYSQSWIDCCDIVMSGGYNPIGNCLWYNTNTLFNNQLYSYGGYTYYKFPGTSSYKKVVEKVIIGNHTFFRIEGY